MRLDLKYPATLLAARAALSLWAIRAYSATFDEPQMLAAGWSYWTQHDMRLDPFSPAPALLYNSAPLLFARLKLPDGPAWRGAFGSAFGEQLLFWNGANGDMLVRSARYMPLVLGLAAGALLWDRCRRAWGPRPAAVGLAFFCFSPALLAHGSLATPDFPLAAWSLAAALALAAFLRAPSRGGAALACGAACAALLSKYSGLALIPAFVAALALAPGRKSARAKTFAQGALPVLAALGVLFLAVPALRSGLVGTLRLVAGGARVYAFGTIYPAAPHWLAFATLAVKSTFAELAVAALAVYFLARRRAAPEALCALLVAGAYVAASAASPKQLGVRYLLPAYAVLPVLAAFAANELGNVRRGPLAAGLLAAWQAACALGAAPDFLPYFNEACGGAAGGDRCLSDSNLDWGQDLKRLGAYAAEHGGAEVVLSYFGTASAETYGLRPQQLGTHAKIQRRAMNSDEPARELLAVSRVNLQGVYADPPGPPSWAAALPEPDARIGASLLVWDVTADEAVHRALAAEYARVGDAALAAHESRRVARIKHAIKP